jgi:hypothetical protein
VSEDRHVLLKRIWKDLVDERDRLERENARLRMRLKDAESRLAKREHMVPCPTCLSFEEERDVARFVAVGIGAAARRLMEAMVVPFEMVPPGTDVDGLLSSVGRMSAELRRLPPEWAEQLSEQCGLGFRSESERTVHEPDDGGSS